MTPTVQEPAKPVSLQDAIDKEFPPANPGAAPAVIHGVDTLTAPDAAIGTTPPPAAAAPPAATPPAAPPAAAATPAPDPAKPLTVEERIAQDEEFKKYLESHTSRVINEARAKWDSEKLQQKLREDNEKKSQERLELARKAKAGDAEAIELLGKDEAARLTQEVGVAEFVQLLAQDMRAEVTKLAGTDIALAQNLDPSRFANVSDWHRAMAEQELNRQIAAKQAEFEAQKQQWQSDLDKLAEAKAVDIVASQRGSLANLEPHLTDLNQPAGFGTASAGGWRQGDWKDYASACRQWNDGLINDNEMALARKLYDERRIPMGVLGAD